MIIAVQRGFTHIVKLLLKGGLFCKPDSRDLHPLHFAALNDDLKMMELLVEHMKITNADKEKGDKETVNLK